MQDFMHSCHDFLFPILRKVYSDLLQQKLSVQYLVTETYD